MLASSSPVVARGIDGATATKALPSAYSPQHVSMTRRDPKRWPTVPATNVTRRAPTVGIWREMSDWDAEDPSARSMSSRM